MHGHPPPQQRLKSGRGFAKSVDPLTLDPLQARCKIVEKGISILFLVPKAESLPPGHKLTWQIWWPLNGFRTQIGRSEEKNCQPESFVQCNWNNFCSAVLYMTAAIRNVVKVDAFLAAQITLIRNVCHRKEKTNIY